MKTVVIEHSPVEVRFNRKFEGFSAYYAIVPKACRPRRPQTKGKVEGIVKYLKANFFQRKHEPIWQFSPPLHQMQAYRVFQ
jgi:transposase